MSVLPEVALPETSGGYSLCAQKVFEILADKKAVFNHCGNLSHIVVYGGRTHIEAVTAEALQGIVERHMILLGLRSDSNGKEFLFVKLLSKVTASALLHQRAQYLDSIPVLKGLTQIPIARLNKTGNFEVIESGYDSTTGLFVHCAKKLPKITEEEADVWIGKLFADSHYTSPGDAGRDYFSYFAPMLKWGGFLKGSFPMIFLEAKESQTGKTYRARTLGLVYGFEHYSHGTRKGGAGSFPELFETGLMTLNPFQTIDNVSNFSAEDGDYLERFLTTKQHTCRAAFAKAALVDTFPYIIQMTSNGWSMKKDSSNRCTFIRYERQEKGRSWEEYDEGDLHAHIEANRHYFVAAIISKIKKWYLLGHPRADIQTGTAFNDYFRVNEWWSLNFTRHGSMIQELESIQERASKPNHVWFRSVSNALNQAGKLGIGITAAAVYDLCAFEKVVVPGLIDNKDEKAGMLAVGRIFKDLFKDGPNLYEQECYTVSRESLDGGREHGEGGGYKVWSYTFSKSIPAEVLAPVVAAPARSIDPAPVERGAAGGRFGDDVVKAMNGKTPRELAAAVAVSNNQAVEYQRL